jgi:hypothetical protein
MGQAPVNGYSVNGYHLFFLRVSHTSCIPVPRVGCTKLLKRKPQKFNDTNCGSQYTHATVRLVSDLGCKKKDRP